MSARKYLNETGLASLWAKIVNKINDLGDLCVKKAGDAVNGVLYWPTDINTNGTYQSPKGEDAIRLDDIFNRRVSVFGAKQVINTKRVETYIETHNYDGGTTRSAKLAMSIDESGNENITVSSPSAWRTALRLATVASSGDYTDLTNKPTIPAAQVNADWNASSGVAQILNKPTIPDISTKVSKSGDTMTGDLILNNKNSIARDTDINPSSNPSSTIYGNGHYLQRSDGSNLGYVRACKSNAGTDFMQIEAQRTISGTNYYNTINLNIASNGTKTVGVSDPSAWRSAIGINNNLATYISADGTNCISANNCNIQFIKCVRIGQIVTCTFHLAHSSAQTGGVAYVALKSDFRPSRQIFFPVSIVGNANAYANESAHRMYLYTDGTLKLNIDNTNATVQQVFGSVSYCIN